MLLGFEQILRVTIIFAIKSVGTQLAKTYLNKICTPEG